MTTMVWVNDPNDKELIDKIAEELEASMPDETQVRVAYQDE